MWEQIGIHVQLFFMDAVRCTLARLAKSGSGPELWLNGAGFDVDRLHNERL